MNLFIQGWKYKLEANFLEIYNEEIRDLLATEKNLKYEIKLSKDEAAAGGIYVTNLHIEEVSFARETTKGGVVEPMHFLLSGENLGADHRLAETSAQESRRGRHQLQ